MELVSIADEMTRTAATMNGDVDVAYGGGGTVIYNNLKTAGFQISNLGGQTMCLYPSSIKTDSPWAKQKVREAMEYALDRDAIAKVAEGGLGSPAYQLAPNFNVAYIPNLEVRKYNITKAKDLLQQAGYSSGFTTTLYCSTASDTNGIISVQANAAAVGITINIQKLAGGAITELITKTGWEGLYIEPFSIYTSFARSVMTKLGTATVDYQSCRSVKRPDGFYYLVDQAQTVREMDPVKEQAIAKMIWDDLTVISIYYAPLCYAIPSYVHDTGYNSLSNTRYYTPEKAWLSKKK